MFIRLLVDGKTSAAYPHQQFGWEYRVKSLDDITLIGPSPVYHKDLPWDYCPNWDSFREGCYGTKKCEHGYFTTHYYCEHSTYFTKPSDHP